MSKFNGTVIQYIIYHIFSSRKVMSFARSQKEKNESEDGYQDYSFGESNIIDANI